MDRVAVAPTGHNQTVDRRISASVAAAPDRTIAALADLSTYPEWLSLVTDAEPIDNGTWNVTLRARLGPLARSKRLRMTRVHSDHERVRFERDEVDGRDHAEWVLEATVAPAGSGSDVVVHLHYSGALWSAPLEIVLASFEGSAAERLSEYLTNA